MKVGGGPPPPPPKIWGGPYFDQWNHFNPLGQIPFAIGDIRGCAPEYSEIAVKIMLGKTPSSASRIGQTDQRHRGHNALSLDHSAAAFQRPLAPPVRPPAESFDQSDHGLD